MTPKQRSNAMKKSWARRKAAQQTLRDQIIAMDDAEDAMGGVTSYMRGSSKLPSDDRYVVIHPENPLLQDLLASVNHPPHYTFGKFEVIDVLLDWFPSNPLLWQVGKYIARAGHKGQELADLKKAEFYLKREIERVENA